MLFVVFSFLHKISSDTSLFNYLEVSYSSPRPGRYPRALPGAVAVIQSTMEVDCIKYKPLTSVFNPIPVSFELSWVLEVIDVIGQ